MYISSIPLWNILPAEVIQIVVICIYICQIGMTTLLIMMTAPAALGCDTQNMHL